MMNLLISGLGGSLFPYLHDQLKGQYNLFYVDSKKDLAHIYDDYNFFVAPLVIDDGYNDFIKKIINDHDIDVYIPLIDEEIEKAHRIKSDVQELILLSPKIEFVNLCLNKYKLMHKLADADISRIETCKGGEIGETTPFPLFLKPIYGRGSRGIRNVNTKEEFDAYVTLEKYALDEILVQESILGQEYTVGVLVNSENDIISISSKKVISKKGITIQAMTEDNAQIEAVIHKINEYLTPCGPYNVQLFLTVEGEIQVFEINPRFSTTTIMSYAGGVNEIALYLEYYGKNFSGSIMKPKTGINLMRAWSNHFYE
jgi:carbamoyl-phosphate synthase large subunit